MLYVLASGVIIHELMRQEGLSGEEVTATPRHTDLLYIRQCTRCNFSVQGKAAKCIIGEATPPLPAQVPPPEGAWLHSCYFSSVSLHSSQRQQRM